MIQNLEKWGGELYFNDSRKTISKGRNGMYTCTGVDIYADKKVARITGINSRKNAVTGHLTIPLEDIPEFITMLKKLI